MLKTSLVAAVVAAIAFCPAYGATKEQCTEAHMKQMDTAVNDMSDAAKKKEAMMHLDMSKAELKKGNIAECMKHMDEAHQAMGM